MPEITLLAVAQANPGYAFIYQGREYRFCSLSCVEKFKVEPEKFCRRASED